MKKLISILLAVLMLFTMAACSKGEGNTTTKTKLEEAKEAGKLTIANVVNGTLGDKSFFDSGNEFVKWVNAEYGDKAYAETIELTYKKETWAQGLSETVADGWDIVICGTYDMKEHVIPLLEEYPDQKWWFYDEEWNFDNPDGWQYAPSDNLYAMMFAQNEGSYCVGYMAAMLSKTGRIAFCGGQNNAVLDDFFVGYANGAKAYNPDIVVECGWMDSFNDATRGKDISQGQYNAGADVVFACGGSAGLGVFDQVITEAEGKYVIGVDGDQGAYFASLGTEEGNAKAARTLTSMQKNVDAGFKNAFMMALEDKVPYGQNERLGLDGGYVSYAVTDTTTTLLTAEQLEEVAGVAAKIADGTVNPGTAFGQADGWFAEFCDTALGK